MFLLFNCIIWHTGCNATWCIIYLVTVCNLHNIHTVLQCVVLHLVCSFTHLHNLSWNLIYALVGIKFWLKNLDCVKMTNMRCAPHLRAPLLCGAKKQNRRERERGREGLNWCQCFVSLRHWEECDRPTREEEPVLVVGRGEGRWTHGRHKTIQHSHPRHCSPALLSISSSGPFSFCIIVIVFWF